MNGIIFRHVFYDEASKITSRIWRKLLSFSDRRKPWVNGARRLYGSEPQNMIDRMEVTSSFSRIGPERSVTFYFEYDYLCQIQEEISKGGRVYFVIVPNTRPTMLKRAGAFAKGLIRQARKARES